MISNFRRPTPEEEKKIDSWKQKMKKIIMDDPELSLLEKLKMIRNLDSMSKGKIVKY